jgi:hypothetical protein
MEQTSSAGYYPDPAGSGGFRYWDGAMWTDAPVVPKLPWRKRFRIIIWSIIAGILIAIAPIVIAFFFGLKTDTSMWDEGSGSGAAIWLMLFSLPLGFIVIVVGCIVGAILPSRPK